MPDVDGLSTIETHILAEQRIHPEATGALTGLLYDLALAGKIIANEMTHAGLAQILGQTGDVNVQGEEVMKLDVLADQAVRTLVSRGGRVAAMVSEEHAEMIQVPAGASSARYVLVYDPLDGSSNVNYNVSVGTIFGIFRRTNPGAVATTEECLRVGRDMVAAGYIVYSASTMLVYSAGHGVHGFTLDRGLGEFLASHPDIRIPEEGRYYSVDQGYQKYWGEGARQFTSYLQGFEGGEGMSQRYVGSLVADFHRTLLSGGVFYYPANSKEETKSQGKLRLLYEAAPLSFIAEQAGGYASDGTQSILEIQPAQLHQRTPLFIGDRRLVMKAEEFIKQYG
ncbi:MAG TPA: class 1 fructose-bisphosphatase [Chloroflexota bacterium]|nr:class 1 fructose-bisphosphatase [Chloroflexota bacterium]